MVRKRYAPEQIASVLLQVEVAAANEKSTEQACWEAGLVESRPSHSNWHRICRVMH